MDNMQSEFYKLSKHKNEYEISNNEVNRIIEMAWEDRTPFEAIEIQFGLKENEVIQIMKKNLKNSSYVLWRKRVKSRPMKHLLKSMIATTRFQAKIHNKLYKNPKRK